MLVLKHWRVGIVGALVSFLALYLLGSQIDLEILKSAFKTARWDAFLICIFLLAIGLVTRAIRWRLLLSNGLSPSRSFHVLNIAYLVNNLLPFRIGEVARVFLSTRSSAPIPVFKTLSTIIVERLLDMLAVVMLVAIALALGPVPPELKSTGLLMGILGLTGFLCLVFLSRNRGFSHRFLGIVVNRIPWLQKMHLVNSLDHFLDGLLPLAQLRTLVLALFWTMISWFISVLAGFVLMYVFYDQASLAVTCLYIAAVAFAIAVPAVPGNLGTFEGAVLLALNALNYGEPVTLAIAFAVTVHASNLFVHFLFGIIGLVAEGISLGQLQQGVQEMSETMKRQEVRDGI